MNNLNKFGLVLSFLLCTISAAKAEAVDKYWEGLSKSYFPNATIEESDAITIKAPNRAENGAQVPFDFNINYPVTDGKYIKSVSVIADSNPVPLVAVYHFTPDSNKVEISTRIRLEVDSYVHVVAETSDGKVLMNKIPIRAAGGCGGTIGGDEALARETAGKMKVSVKPTENEQSKDVVLMIKHPMYTGLQRDLESQGYRPAFFINKVTVKFNSQTILDADTYIGVSEDPSIRFPLSNSGPGVLSVIIQDNEGKTFNLNQDVI